MAGEEREYILNGDLKKPEVKDFSEKDLSENDLKLIDAELNDRNRTKNVHFINWKRNEPVINRYKHLKASIQQKLARNMLEGNNESIIDMRKCDIDEDFLKCLRGQIKNYDIYGIVWKDDNPFKDSEVVKYMEDWIEKRNQEYRRYPSDYIYCLLASHCWQINAEVRNSLQGTGWIIEEKYPSTSEYFSVLYKNESTRQMVLAFKGLKFKVNDLFDQDADVNSKVYENVGNQLNAFLQKAYIDTKLALELSEKMKYSLSFTGYLFGAWLAEQSVFFCYKEHNNLNVRAVTFESPGSFKILKSLSKSDFLKKDAENFDDIMKTLDIKSYLFSPNFVNTIGVHLGKVYRLIDPSKTAEKTKVMEKFILNKIINEIKDDGVKQVVTDWFKDTLKPNLHVYFFYLNGLRSLFSEDLLWILDLFDKRTGLLKGGAYLEVVSWPELAFKARGTYFYKMSIKNALEIKKYDKGNTSKATDIDFNTQYGIRWMTRKSLESLSAILVIVAEMTKGNLKMDNLHELLKYGANINEHPERKDGITLYDEQTYKMIYYTQFKIKNANLKSDFLKYDPLHPDKPLREFYFGIDPRYKNSRIAKRFDDLKRQFKITEKWNGKMFIGSIVTTDAWVDEIRERFLRYFKVNAAYESKITHEETSTTNAIEEAEEDNEIEEEITKCFADIDKIINSAGNETTTSSTTTDDDDEEEELEVGEGEEDDEGNNEEKNPANIEDDRKSNSSRVSILEDMKNNVTTANPTVTPEEENIPEIFQGEREKNFIKTEENIFQKIDKLLSNNHYAYVIGTSGYGKSTLAREYGYYKKDTERKSCIQFMVSGGSLSNNLVELKHRFITDKKIKTCDIKPDELICLIRNKLLSSSRVFLIILDNVLNIADIKLILGTFSEIKESNIRFLITTKNEKLFEKEDKSGAFGITIKGFDERCCFEYLNLNGINPVGEERENWRKLIKECKGKDGCISPKTFVIAIQTYTKQGGGFDRLKKLLLNKEMYGQFKNDETAIEILNHMSYLDGNAIELPLIKKIFINQLDGDFDVAMKYLIDNAFLKETKEGEDQSIYQIHETTQNDLKSMLENQTVKKNDILTKLVCVLNQSVEKDVSVQKMSKVEEIKKVDNHTKKIIEANWKDKTNDANYLDLLMKATKYNEKMINYEDSVKLMKEVCEIEKKKLKESDPKKISTLHNLGLNYFKQGKYTEALEQYEEAIKLLEENNLKKHPNYAASLSNVGLVYISQEKYDLAWNYYAVAIDIFRENGDHELTSKAFFNMGCINQHKKNFETALNDYNNALTNRKKVRETKRTRTAQENKQLLLEEANVVNNMASCYSSMRNYKRALKMFERAYNMRKLVLPDKHSELAKSLNNIGCIEVYLKHYRSAQYNFKLSIVMRKEVHPPNHPDIASSLFNMGEAYYHKKSFKKALKLLKEALRIYKLSLPSNHPSIEQTAQMIKKVERAVKQG